jgi:CRISPR-associated protein Cmr1
MGLTEWNRDEGRFLLTRSYIEPGREWELKLRFPEDDIGTLALRALRLLTMYGGLGARVRRGFGGVRLLGTDGPLAGPWTEDALKGSGLRDHAGKRALELTGELARCRDILVALRPKILRELDRPEASAPEGSDGPPSHPVLSPNWSVAGLGARKCGNWEEVLRYAGNSSAISARARRTRARQRDTSQGSRLPNGKKWSGGTATTSRLERSGSPVVFKDGYVVNVDRGRGDDSDKLRRASPLWFRAAEYSGNWALLSFAFLCQFLPGPDAPGIHLWHNGQQGKPLQVTTDDVKRLATQ